MQAIGHGDSKSDCAAGLPLLCLASTAKERLHPWQASQSAQIIGLPPIAATLTPGLAIVQSVSLLGSS